LLELLLPYLAPADLNAAGGDAKQTCLHMAAEAGAVRALRALIAHAGPRDLDYGARDAAGCTPLDVARAAGNPEVIALLTQTIMLEEKRGEAVPVE